jgi:arginyl-tRNA synthetase
VKNYLINAFQKAAEKLEYLKEIELQFSVPSQKNFGDFSTNAAMMLTKKLKRNPREIAEEIISHLDLNPNIIEKTEIAGPGFINFHFKAEYITQIVKEIFDKGENFGKNEIFKGKRALVEFVSANPTGPLTVGHGRNAVVGDTVARLLEWVGYEVTREYYFNNAGRQMRVLGDSVRIRYLQLLGHQVEFPEDYYQGNYIKEIANKLFEEYGASLTDEPAEGIFKQRAEKEIFNDIKNTLKRLGIEFDNFYNEHSLYESGKIDAVIKEFQKRNLTYEKDGALWLKLTELGNEADKVIIKSSGEPTYRLPDIAYHLTKFERGYDLIIDLFGSDHAATYPDVLAAVKALGKDISKVKVLIHQFVTIMQGEQVVKMSTRKANYITLDYLIDEVGADVVRYFFIMRNINSHLNFDIELAKKQSDENPVFYLQYAHARICSIIRTVEREGIKESTENLALLTTEPEQNLLKKLWLFEEEISNAAVNFEPHKVTGYLEELATAFHKFYTECRILGSPKELASARLSLAIATKQIIRTGLSLLGVSAPEKM